MSSNNLSSEGGAAWHPAKPMRDTSWWHRRKREKACGEHDWHPENTMAVDWYCSKCGKETQGWPS